MPGFAPGIFVVAVENGPGAGGARFAAVGGSSRRRVEHIGFRITHLADLFAT